MTLILKLDAAGRPIGWSSTEAGALLYCRDQVAWEAGDTFVRLRGGHSRRTGARTILDVNSILATRSINQHVSVKEGVPALTNAQLFRRDTFMCMYCGEVCPPRELTRDHVIPLSRGGQDTWENMVTACRACNHRKDSRLLEHLEMKLLAVPYAPNRAEALILSNRRILADQMTFLRARVSKISRLHRTSKGQRQAA